MTIHLVQAIQYFLFVFFGLSWSMMMVCWPEAEKFKTFTKGSSIMMFGSEFSNRIRKIWKVDKDLVDSNKKMGSNVPLLMLSGEYDHVCAYQHAQKLAKNFDTAYNYIFKAIAYSPVDAGPCGIKLIKQFIDNPTKEPDASCVQQFKGKFMLP